jgi:hypothetical protein
MTITPINDLDFSGLTTQQRVMVKQMLEEEKESFSTSDDDIGCIEELELKLNMKDQTPVQKTFNSIPRPLYPEVKQYIEDLLNRGWITKSKSPYSSPVVCVRKKNGELRLCVDYRELNKRTTPDRHPLPRVQDTLDGLGGNKWFSLVDQGKAYHQGFMHVEIRVGAYTFRLDQCPSVISALHGRVFGRTARRHLPTLFGRYNSVQ